MVFRGVKNRKQVTLRFYRLRNFYRFWVIKEKPAGGNYPFPHTQIRIKPIRIFAVDINCKSLSNFYQLHVFMVTLCTHDIMTFGGN